MDTSREGSPSARKSAPRVTEEPVPKLGPEHQRLEVLVGEWKGEGTLGEASETGAGGRVTTEERYEWLPGGFFLTYRGVMRFTKDGMESTRIVGFDPVTRRYQMYQFDQFGYARVYESGGPRDGAWTFAGPHERVTMTFSDDNHTMDSHWEQSDDGVTWRVLCDLKATRVQ